VALVGQVSTATGLGASCLPDGANVLCAEEDFTSVLFPFLVNDRLNVRTVPLDHLLDEIGADTDLVAVSAAQSADGRVLDLDDLATASRDAQAQTYVGLHDRGPVGGLDGAPSLRLVCGRRPVAVDLRAAVAPGHGRPPLQRLTAEVVRSLGR
jgi:hypothetical protein